MAEDFESLKATLKAALETVPRATPIENTGGSRSFAAIRDGNDEESLRREISEYLGFSTATIQSVTDVQGIYNKIFDGLTDFDEDFAATNALDAYISPAYHVALYLTDAKPGSDTSFDGLLSASTVGFASTGTNSAEVTDFYNIESINMRSVVSVTAANPELSSVIECKVELTEPHGMSLDYRLRAAATSLGFAQENPANYVWRMDIWFSGYLPDGTWVNKIDFGGFRGGDSVDTVTHFFHIITLDAEVKSSGTMYSLTMVPMGLGAATRPENLFSDSKEIELPFEAADVRSFFDALAAEINKQSELKQARNTVVFTYPDEIAGAPIGTAGDNNTGSYEFNEGKVKVTIGRHHSILQAAMTALKSVKSLQIVGSDAGSDKRPSGSPNLSFKITPSADFSTATRDAKRNTYTGVTYRYDVEPYLEWKSQLPGNAQERLPWANKAVRRIYDYAWTPTNTEVISLNAKLSLFYYINEGLLGLTGRSSEGMLGGSATPGAIAEERSSRMTLMDRVADAANGNYPGGSSYNTDYPSGDPTAGKGRVTSLYGPRNGKFHSGVDLAVPVGTELYATASGKVTKARNTDPNGYGESVEISHRDGRVSKYAHMSRYNVSEGTYVRKGDLIGWSGNTGYSTGPHLHYEIWENGNKIDPLSSLGGHLRPNRQAPTESHIDHDHAPKSVKQSDVSNSSVSGDGTLGRRIAVISPDIMPGATSLEEKYREQYELAFERRIGRDLVKLEGMTVRGDPRWLLAEMSGPMKKFSNLSSLIIINMLVPDQSEYMSASPLPRQRDLNLGGYYEVVTIEHKIEGGKFTQVLGGYRVLGLNGALPFDGNVTPEEDSAEPEPLILDREGFDRQEWALGSAGGRGW